MASFEIKDCVLEVDQDRGVLYVHSPDGFTALRICGMPPGAPLPSPSQMLDVTLKGQDLASGTFSWGAR